MAEAAPADGSRRAERTILVCEDEEGILRATQRILSSRGYAVLAAASAEKAREIAAGHEGRLDLLITDVQLEGMSGVDLGRALSEARADLRVLFVSGSGRDEVFRDHESPHAFLEKPFTPETLLGTVERLLFPRAEGDE